MIARASLLRFQATWLCAALRRPLLRRGWACFRKRRMLRFIDGRSHGDGGSFAMLQWVTQNGPFVAWAIAALFAGFIVLTGKV